MRLTAEEDSKISENIHRASMKNCISQLDADYLHLLQDIMYNGDVSETRTGLKTIGLSNGIIKFDCTKALDNNIAFPILSCKKILTKAMWIELEGFIKGITDKSWYQSRGCNIWNEWHNPKTDDENDLGKIYGYQWNNFNGVNQLQNLLKEIDENPTSRRMIVSAWNPAELDEMALPPCHIIFQIIIKDKFMDLNWYQRSVDIPLGLPFNISSYGSLLILLAKTTGYIPRYLTGFLGDVHIYENQIDIVKEQLLLKDYNIERTSEPTCLVDDKLIDIYDFDHASTFTLNDYFHYPFVKFERAAV
jgi:thymidylate synthase